MKSTPAAVVEELIFKKALELKLLAADDPSIAFLKLLDRTAAYLRSRKSHGEDITLEWFRAIKTTPELLALHATAVRPTRGITEEKRRQYVHQRIGRFVKEHLGFESVREVVLPRDAGELIRSYTKLAPS